MQVDRSRDGSLKRHACRTLSWLPGDSFCNEQPPDRQLVSLFFSPAANPMPKVPLSRARNSISERAGRTTALFLRLSADYTVLKAFRTLEITRKSRAAPHLALACCELSILSLICSAAVSVSHMVITTGRKRESRKLVLPCSSNHPR